ncbi:MAG: DUF1015 family protein [Acidimicrobiia bacterium]|nr:MAG: DUF1015 family protein [Acidimicrobiia bacterium]
MFLMLYPFHPLLYSDEAVAAFGEPSRLSSDRDRTNGNPVSVDRLYAPDMPGAFQPSDHRIHRWLQDGTVRRGTEPVFVRYTVHASNQELLAGIVGVLDLDETTPLPHEATTPSLVAARRADLERAGAMFEPVLLVTRAGTGLSSDSTASLRSVQYEAETHSVVAIDPSGLERPFPPEASSLVIADGHHRVKAIVEHARSTNQRPLALVMIVDSVDAGPLVHPQHRVLAGTVPQRPESNSDIDIRPYVVRDPVPQGAVGIVTDSDAWLAVPRFPSLVSAAVLERHVAPALGLSIGGVATHEEDALRELERGAAAAAIMGPMSIDQIVDEAERGRILPHKATYFSPKLAVGLVGTLRGERDTF